MLSTCLSQLFSRRELRVGRPRGEGAQLVPLAGRGAVLGGSVEVTLAEDDHSDVGVEVDFAGFRAREPVALISHIISYQETLRPMDCLR